MASGTRWQLSKAMDRDDTSWRSQQIDLACRYGVNGQSYVGQRATHADFVVKMPSALNAIVAEYAKNKTVNVYDNPKRPSDSVLIPGVSWYNFGPMVVGLLLIAVGLFLGGYRLD